MEERVALAKLSGAGFLTEITIGAVGTGAFEAGTEIERADIIATMAVGARFFGVSELHGTSLIRLQQHLNQRIGTAFLAELFLIAN